MDCLCACLTVRVAHIQEPVVEELEDPLFLLTVAHLDYAPQQSQKWVMLFIGKHQETTPLEGPGLSSLEAYHLLNMLATLIRSPNHGQRGSAGDICHSWIHATAT